MLYIKLLFPAHERFLIGIESTWLIAIYLIIYISRPPVRSIIAQPLGVHPSRSLWERGRLARGLCAAPVHQTVQIFIILKEDLPCVSRRERSVILWTNINFEWKNLYRALSYERFLAISEPASLKNIAKKLLFYEVWKYGRKNEKTYLKTKKLLSQNEKTLLKHTKKRLPTGNPHITFSW